MKILDIAIKDLLHSLRNAMGLVQMFGIPLLVTGMFYFMFGNIAGESGFSLARVHVVIANLDTAAPRLEAGGKTLPDDIHADTISELVVEVLRSKDLADLLEVRLAPDAATARQAVDDRQAGVAIIIPAGFARSFADPYDEAELEFYQDPTLTIGPRVVRSILNQFMDGLAGIKIAVDVALDEDLNSDANGAVIARFVPRYLETTPTQDKDLSADLLETRLPQQNQPAAPTEETSPMVRFLGPIMAGMMVFYAFYTGTSAAESILSEEEDGTLQRLFTTPTPQAAILTGKLLAVFLTVLVQVVVLILASRALFSIRWGNPAVLALGVVGVVACASSTGIFINSLLKNTKQGGVIFGGVLTLTGMIGMIPVFFAANSNSDALAGTASLLVPQGWALRGVVQAMNGLPVQSVLVSLAVALVWSAVFFTIGVWRFNRRYL